MDIILYGLLINSVLVHLSWVPFDWWGRIKYKIKGKIGKIWASRTYQYDQYVKFN